MLTLDQTSCPRDSLPLPPPSLPPPPPPPPVQPFALRLPYACDGGGGGGTGGKVGGGKEHLLGLRRAVRVLQIRPLLLPATLGLHSTLIRKGQNGAGMWGTVLQADVSLLVLSSTRPSCEVGGLCRYRSVRNVCTAVADKTT